MFKLYGRFQKKEDPQKQFCIFSSTIWIGTSFNEWNLVKTVRMNEGMDDCMNEYIDI
jgi:hypothetical protein